MIHTHIFTLFQRADIAVGPFGILPIDIEKFHTTPVSVIDRLVPISGMFITHATDSGEFFRMIDTLAYVMLILTTLLVPLTVAFIEATLRAAKNHSTISLFECKSDFYNLVTATLAGMLNLGMCIEHSL